MKVCPFCAEEIQDEAIKCKHCGEFLNQKPKAPAGPWYLNPFVIASALLTIGPFALPLVWINPKYSLILKIVITVVVLVLTWWMIIFVQQLMGQLKEIMSSYKGTL